MMKGQNCHWFIGQNSQLWKKNLN